MPSQFEGAERPEAASSAAPAGKSPAFQVYPGDFLSDMNVALMTTEQVGAYWLLILHDWKENGLPLDLEDLSVLVKMDPAKFGAAWEKRINRCFVPHPDKAGHVTHPRLIKERAGQEANRVKRQMAANTRWNAYAEQKQSSGNASGIHVHTTSTAPGMHMHSVSIPGADAMQCSSASTSSSTAKEDQKLVAPTSGAVRVADKAAVKKAASTAAKPELSAAEWVGIKGAYPGRKGNQEWPRAERYCKELVRDGRATAAELLLSAQRYAVLKRIPDKDGNKAEGTKWVKMAASYFNPKERAWTELLNDDDFRAAQGATAEVEKVDGDLWAAIDATANNF